MTLTHAWDFYLVGLAAYLVVWATVLWWKCFYKPAQDKRLNDIESLFEPTVRWPSEEMMNEFCICSHMYRDHHMLALRGNRICAHKDCACADYTWDGKVR